jgi:hypothetical protein
MHTTSLTLQDIRTGRVSRISDALSDLAGAAAFCRLRVAIAYATRSGCSDLSTSFRQHLFRWRTVRKHWLISIDFGTTEAQALEYLRDLPRSEVRISDARRVLDQALFPDRPFHPKTFILDSDGATAKPPFAVFVGSANLTLSGRHAGVEHGTSFPWLAPLTRSETMILKNVELALSWWDLAWREAFPVTDELLEEYRRKCPVFQRGDATRSVRGFSSSKLRVLDATAGVAWSNARCLWVQTHELYKNFGPDRPGNQLDLRRGTKVYFGFPADTVSRNTVLGRITLRFEGKPRSLRSVRFGNNSMDKVNLPIPGEDGPDSYDNSVAHFERLKLDRFRVKLGDKKDLAHWRRLSLEQRMRYSFGLGGREFGFYN